MGMASTSVTSRIDDRDPRIVYTGNWEAAGDPEHEFDGTSHGTRSNGAQALFTFVGKDSITRPFSGHPPAECALAQGSAVSVYGTIEKGTLGAAGAPTSSYTIDGSAVGRFTGTPKSDTVFKQPFFVSGTLPSAGNHTLVITCTGTGGNAFWLDFLEISVDPNQTSSSSSSSTSATSQVSWSASATQSQSTGLPSTPSQGGLTTGTIVGIALGSAIGGLLLAIIIVLLFCLVRRRRRHNKHAPFAAVERPPAWASTDTTAGLTPFGQEPNALLVGRRDADLTPVSSPATGSTAQTSGSSSGYVVSSDRPQGKAASSETYPDGTSSTGDVDAPPPYF